MSNYVLSPDERPLCGPAGSCLGCQQQGGRNAAPSDLFFQAGNLGWGSSQARRYQPASILSSTNPPAELHL